MVLPLQDWICSPFYNVMLGIAMLLGRFGVILPVLALAGSLAKKPGAER